MSNFEVLHEQEKKESTDTVQNPEKGFTNTLFRPFENPGKHNEQIKQSASKREVEEQHNHSSAEAYLNAQLDSDQQAKNSPEKQHEELVQKFEKMVTDLKNIQVQTNGTVHNFALANISINGESAKNLQEASQKIKETKNLSPESVQFTLSEKSENKDTATTQVKLTANDLLNSKEPVQKVVENHLTDSYGAAYQSQSSEQQKAQEAANKAETKNEAPKEKKAPDEKKAKPSFLSAAISRVFGPKEQPREQSSQINVSSGSINRTASTSG